MHISGDKVPTLKLPLCYQLYSLDLKDCEATLREILASPRDIVIEDLHKIIENSIIHQDIYVNEPSESQIDKDLQVESYPFVLHAVYLLGELKSENSLEYFFKILSQSDDYINAFIGMDIASEAIWEPIYRLANHQPNAFRPFLLKNDVSFFRKSVFLSVSKQIYWHQPERREEINQWYMALLNDLITRAKQEQLADTDFIGCIVWDMLDLQIEAAAPLIRQAYERDLVSTSICGSLEDVLEDLGTKPPVVNKRPVLDIFYRYKVLNQEMVEPFEKSTTNKVNLTLETQIHEPESSRISQQSTPYIKEAEPGRNEPCPCGSGKKFKKCCLGK